MFWKALIACLLLAGPVCAQRTSGYQNHPYISPTIPNQQLAAVGALDRRGFGGIQVQNLGGTLSIVSEVNNATSAASTDLVLDGWGHLVFTGTYGNTLASGSAITVPTGSCTYPTPTHGYLVTLTNGLYTGTVCVSVVASTAYARSHYVAPNYAPAGYTLSNPDNPSSFQLRTYGQDTAFPLDGAIKLRGEAGTTGVTPGLNPTYANFESSSGSVSSQLYAVAIPGDVGALAKYAYSDGSGAAQVTDDGTSTGTTLSWTTMNAHTGTGLNGSHTYAIDGPGVAYGTTATCTAAGTGAGTCTLNQALLATFVSGEKVIISGNISIASESPETGNDENGNPLRGGNAQIGQLRIQPASDFYAPITLRDVTFYLNTPPSGNVNYVCGTINNGTDGVAGNIMTIMASAGSCGTTHGPGLAVGQAVTEPHSAANTGQIGGVFIIADGNTVNTACGGLQCTGTGGNGTYEVDVGNGGTSVTQTVGTAASPRQLAAQVYGDFGGIPGGYVNQNTMLASIAGWGVTIYHNRFEVGPAISDQQIAQNIIFPLQANAANVIANAFYRGSSNILLNTGAYMQRTGTVASACTGSQPTLTCKQNYVTSNFSTRSQADFLDLTVNTGDTDAESNLFIQTNTNFGTIIPAVGDQFTINDTTGSTTKTYTFASSVLSGGNVDGNVPTSTNPVMNQINMVCTINAAHNAYVQMAPFRPVQGGVTVQGMSSFLCVDGVNLPAAETADPSVLATYDSLNSESQYFLPLFALTPGHTLTTSWFSQLYNQPISVNGSDCPSTICSMGQFVATYGSDLSVSSITSGQVVIGAVLTNVSGATIPANTRVTGFVPATAPGGVGHYTLSAAITCSACTMKQTITNWRSVSQSTLHPDFMQPFGLTTTANIPLIAKYNIAVRGPASPNVYGPQGFTDNGGSNACCFVSTATNNIAINTLQGAFSAQMYLNSTVARNLLIADVASNVFDPTTPSTYNAILGENATTPNPVLYRSLLQTVCSNAGSGNNAFTGNIANNASLSCGTTPNVLSPSIQTTMNWNTSTESPQTVALRYATMFPAYPTTLNTGTGGCGSTRATMLACLTPARGVTFTADLSTSCILTTATSLPVNTHVSGPGLPDPGLGGSDNHISTSGGVSPYQVATTGCTTETAQTFSTGALNVDGTYSGALFPANDFSEVCWNDGSVWDKTQHCTAAS